MENTIIEFSHVTKRFRKHFWTKSMLAVSDCSFTVKKNSVTGFVGPNGAGKTTSLKMVLGLVRPDRGIIRIRGLGPENPKSRIGVSFLSERPYFYDHLTVTETLQFAIRLQNIKNVNEKPAISKALETVELSSSATQKVKDLSKGMQQRLSMAQALVTNPDIFILDEPMSGLDPLGRRLFRTIFSSLCQQGKSIFFSTHILDDVESLCTDVIVLSKGTMAYQGSVEHLLSQGLLGTEILIADIPENVSSELISKGNSVSKKNQNKTVVFVPKEKDVKQVILYLQNNGIFSETITHKHVSLEERIYNIDATTENK